MEYRELEKRQKVLGQLKQIENILEKEEVNEQDIEADSSVLEDMVVKAVKDPSNFYFELADTLSPKERQYLEKLIEHKDCNSCINFSCRVEHYEKIGLDESGQPKGTGCLGWENPILIGRQKVLEKISK